MSAVKYVLMALLKVYRTVISPLYGDVCKYYPSCSAYALEAVRVHGALKGSWLALRRIGRCTPWTTGHGHDPVPPREQTDGFGTTPQTSRQTRLSAGNSTRGA